MIIPKLHHFTKLKIVLLVGLSAVVPTSETASYTGFSSILGTRNSGSWLWVGAGAVAATGYLLYRYISSQRSEADQRSESDYKEAPSYGRLTSKDAFEGIWRAFNEKHYYLAKDLIESAPLNTFLIEIRGQNLFERAIQLKYLNGAREILKRLERLECDKSTICKIMFPQARVLKEGEGLLEFAIKQAKLKSDVLKIKAILGLLETQAEENFKIEQVLIKHNMFDEINGLLEIYSRSNLNSCSSARSSIWGASCNFNSRSDFRNM